MRNLLWSVYARAVFGMHDERGLSMLAYALGAAVVIGPLAVAIWGFGSDAATDAKTQVEAAIPTP